MTNMIILIIQPLFTCQCSTFKIHFLWSNCRPCIQGHLFNENTVSSRVSSCFCFTLSADSGFHLSSFTAKLSSLLTIEVTSSVCLIFFQSKFSVSHFRLYSGSTAEPANLSL